MYSGICPAGSFVRMWNVWTAYDMYGADINPIIGVTAQRSDARNTPLEIFPGSGPPSSSTLSPDGFNEATITYGKVIDSIFGIGGTGSEEASFACQARQVVLGAEVATYAPIDDECVAGIRLLCGPPSAPPPVAKPRWTAWMGKQGTLKHRALCPCGTFLEEVNAESLRATGLVVDLGARCSAPAVGKPQKSFTLFSGRGNDGFTVQSTDGFNKAATLSATTAMLRMPGRIPSCSKGQVVLGLEVATRRVPALTQPQREALTGVRFYCGDPATALCTRC